MKKHLLILMAWVAIVFSSCQKEDLVPVADESSEMPGIEQLFNKEVLTDAEMAQLQEMLNQVPKTKSTCATCQPPGVLKPQVFKKTSNTFTAVGWVHFPAPCKEVRINMYCYELVNGSWIRRRGKGTKESMFIWNHPAGSNWYASMDRVQVNPNNKVIVITHVICKELSGIFGNSIEFYLRDL